MGLPARDEACSLPSLRYMAVSIGCVNKVHSPRGVLDMCESGRGGGGGVVRGSVRVRVTVCMGGGPRVRVRVCLGGGIRVWCVRAGVCMRYLKDYSHVYITYVYVCVYVCVV